MYSWLRSGNTASARGAENFLEEALALLPSPTAIRYLRADSGFGIESFLSRVEEKGLVYAIDGFAQKRFFATEAAFRLVCVTFNLVSLLQERIGPSYQTLGTLRSQLLACGIRMDLALLGAKWERGSARRLGDGEGRGQPELSPPPETASGPSRCGNCFGRRRGTGRWPLRSVIVGAG